MRLRPLLAASMVLPLAGAALAALATPAVDPALAAQGWQELAFDGKPANRYRAGPDGAIEVAADRSVSLLQKPVQVDLAEQPRLHWRWRVDQAVPATDLAVKGSDDRSLALYVAFPFVPEQASWWERVKRRMVETVAGQDAPGRVLNYVWGGQGAAGQVIVSPYYGRAGMMKILRPAASPSGVWFEESVDLVADYRAAFGSEPPDPVNLAVSADADDTGSQIRAEVAGLRFAGQ